MQWIRGNQRLMEIRGRNKQVLMTKGKKDLIIQVAKSIKIKADTLKKDYKNRYTKRRQTYPKLFFTFSSKS